MYYYVTRDDKGFVNVQPGLEPKEGYTKVEVDVTDKEYFLRYYDKYRLDDSGRLQAPGNLPDISIDTLVGLANRQQKQIEQQTTTVTGLQQALGQATQAQVQAQQKFDTSNQQFQQQFGALTQQFVELQKQVTDLNPAETADAK